MTTYRLSSPDGVTTAMENAAPDRMTNKGWYIANTWFADSCIDEIGRGTTAINSPDNQGTSYHVSAAVKQHDSELYGL